jgi:predicted GTPase
VEAATVESVNAADAANTVQPAPDAAAAAAGAAAAVSLSSFNDYKRAVLDIAGDLKQLREYTAELKLDKSVQLIDDVLRRIEENCFSIAIVGEFKRGKSTLINALLGKDILPSDIMPCSATLNRVPTASSPPSRSPSRTGVRSRSPLISWPTM